MSSRQCAVLAASLLLPLSNADAQTEFPNKPIKVVVTVAPGAASDAVARRLAEHVQDFVKYAKDHPA